MQVCKRCNTEKSLSEFYKTPRTKTGYRGTCKQCAAEQAAERYSKKKEFVGHNQKNLPIPSQEELKEMFDYHPDGGFIRLKSRGSQKSGSVTFGKKEKHGYKRLPINYSVYLVHRLIWKWHHGTEPEFLDHINRDRSDNRIENLRECTKNDNARNLELPKNNTSGFYGVRPYPYNGLDRWAVALRVEGKSIGRIVKTLDDAVELYEQLALEHHGEFAKDKIAHNRKQLNRINTNKP